MPVGPTLETDRLILRVPSAEDFEGFCEMYADADSMTFLGGVQARPTVWRSVAYVIGAWSLRGYSMWSVIEKSTGKWIGRLGPINPEGWPAPEIGWGLLKSAEGKGYATEGAVAAMNYVFDDLGWDSVIHCIDKDNAGSIKLAERLGSTFQRKAKAPESIGDFEWDLYGQSATQWQENRHRFITGA